MILILLPSNNQIPHLTALLSYLEQYQTAYYILPLWEFPEKVQLTFSPNDIAGGVLIHQGNRILFQDIGCVYWTYSPTYVSSDQPSEQPCFLEESLFKFGTFNRESTLIQEKLSALGSWFRLLNCPWVDAIDTIENHLYKAYQLGLFQQASALKFPETRVTNSPDSLKEFCEIHSRVIVKPCFMGAYATWLTPELLTPDKLERLKTAPVMLQSYIPGFDIIAIIVENLVFASRIEPEECVSDFRQGTKNRYLPIALPDDIARQCLSICQALNTHFSAIDLRYTPEGEFILLEINPSPSYWHVEQATGYPITEQLAQLLLKLHEGKSATVAFTRDSNRYFNRQC